jgi:hypothetical protein
MRESDIIYESPNGKAWVYRDRKHGCYTVMLIEVTHSISDSAYALTDDSLSIAKARANYFDRKTADECSRVIRCIPH